MEESGLFDLAAELELPVRYWHVMDSGKDSTDLLKSLLDRFGSRLSYAIVLTSSAAMTSPSSSNRERRSGARAERDPHLDQAPARSVITKIDARSSSFWAAGRATRKDATGLGLLERQRVKLWLRHAYGEIREGRR